MKSLFGFLGVFVLHWCALQ